MRRRRRKDADKKLLSYEDYIINGMINQVFIDNTDSENVQFDINSNKKEALNKGNPTTYMTNTNKDNQYLNPFDNRVFIKDEVYYNIIDKYRGKWSSIFGNDNPIYVEVGTGRGQFITGLAKKNPNINYIALEIKEEVLIRAVEKADRLDLDNVLFLWGSVELLDLYFEDKELDRIYINFCDPWPKKRNSKRRLTSSLFIDLYEKKLNCGQIHFKTDNKDLFEFSLNEFSDKDLKLSNISLDLVKSDFKDNVTTEYEDKFMRLGMPIYRLEAEFRKQEVYGPSNNYTKK